LRLEAIEKYTEISQFMDDEAPTIEVGSAVECDYAFVGYGNDSLLERTHL
jgi:hypothetical protein